MSRKLFICPWFGPLPEWMPDYLADIARLAEYGYYWLVDTDYDMFRERVRERLDVECPPMYATGKIHDYRACLAVLYADEIKGYDWFGHTDFDIAYGNPANFITDKTLAGLDAYSDGWDYINGPWTLYRNFGNDDQWRLYELIPNWEKTLEDPRATGWVEAAYSDVVKQALGKRLLITNHQARNLNNFAHVERVGDELYERNREILFAHFRRTKVYPPQLRLSGP